MAVVSWLPVVDAMLYLSFCPDSQSWLMKWLDFLASHRLAQKHCVCTHLLLGVNGWKYLHLGLRSNLVFLFNMTQADLLHLPVERDL